MRFEWDETKRIRNLRVHGFDFRDAYRVFENPVFTIADDRFEYGETRYFSIGILTGRTVALSHTLGDEVIRVISLRKANKHEQEIYFAEIRN